MLEYSWVSELLKNYHQTRKSHCLVKLACFPLFCPFSHSPENSLPMKALYIPQGDLPTPPVVYYMTQAALRPEGFEKRGKNDSSSWEKSPTCLCFQFTFCYLFWISIFYQPYVWFFKRLQPPSSFFHCKSQCMGDFLLSAQLSTFMFAFHLAIIIHMKNKMCDIM